MYNTALELLNKINEFNFKAYIVGGFSRDLYINKESTDVDICTNATPKEIKEIFKESKINNEQYGSVSLIYNNVRFEITTFRKEKKYENNRYPIKIKYIDNLVDDLLRRDFTINTLCIDSDGNYIDLLNARQDIDNKIIKCVGDANKKIKEDILRSLRAIRFATILNFKLDEKLKKAIKKNKKLIKKLSYYRKKEELEKIFSSQNCKYGIDLIKELELDKVLEINTEIVITTSSLGIWAQLDVLDIYPFTKNEKEIINNIKLALQEDILNNNVLYKYGLYVCTLVGEIKNVDRVNIVKKYNSLPIFSVKDIDINANQICEILNKEKGPFIKEVYKDLESKILNNLLENDFDKIKDYLEHQI